MASHATALAWRSGRDDGPVVCSDGELGPPGSPARSMAQGLDTPARRTIDEDPDKDAHLRVFVSKSSVNFMNTGTYFNSIDSYCQDYADAENLGGAWKAIAS